MVTHGTRLNHSLWPKIAFVMARFIGLKITFLLISKVGIFLGITENIKLHFNTNYLKIFHYLCS